MISKIGLHNFKAFKKLDSINIAPLTVVMGKNSSGKSSILHSLLLLKQTAESRNRDAALALDGKYLRYSNLSEIAYGLPDPVDARLSFDLEVDTGKGKGKSIQIGIKNKSDEGGGAHHPAIDFVKFKLNNGHEVDLVRFDLKKVLKGKGRGKLGIAEVVFERAMQNTVPAVIFDKIFPEYIKFDLKTHGADLANGSGRLPFDFLFSDVDGFDVLRRSLEDLRYLGPVRAAPERAYIHYSDDAFELSEDGRNSAHILWAKSEQSVRWKGQDLKLTDAVNACIQCVGLQQKVTPKRMAQITYQIAVDIPGMGKDVTIADVGFGYSQVIPIVLTGLLNDKKNLMLIEQPEIHLHPSSCANLADLFLGFIQDGRRFIIETHSQDFVNRLRLRVIEDPSLKEKINIVFVDEATEDGAAGATARQFQIDENGSFPEWPTGFIDESEKGARAIIKARSQRASAAKEAKMAEKE